MWVLLDKAEGVMSAEVFSHRRLLTGNAGWLFCVVLLNAASGSGPLLLYQKLTKPPACGQL